MPLKRRMPLSKNEFVILAQNACINDFRWKNATRDAHVNELESDVRKEKGAREVAQQKNAHLELENIDEELEDLREMKKDPGKSNPGAGALIGVFVGGFLACYFFLLLAGVLHP